MGGRFRTAIKSGAGSRPGLLAGQAKPRIADIDGGLLVFNFKFFDSTQGQTFEQWEEQKLLAQTMGVFKGYSTMRLQDALSGGGFKCYGSIPGHSEFKHPKHIPEDAKWSSMHIQGKPCVIGHLVGNVFYVVFLDADHKFWPTDLQSRGK